MTRTLVKMTGEDFAKHVMDTLANDADAVIDFYYDDTDGGKGAYCIELYTWRDSTMLMIGGYGNDSVGYYYSDPEYLRDEILYYLEGHDMGKEVFLERIEYEAEDNTKKEEAQS